MFTHDSFSPVNKPQSKYDTASVQRSESEAMIVDNRQHTVTQLRLKELAEQHVNRLPVTQLQTMASEYAEKQALPVQRKANYTGLPDQLKTGVESLSGYSMDDVKVHYNSSKPSTLQAHAYAHGTEIHLAPGQEKYLPHETWHVVQQKQGRVQPTRQLKGKQPVAVNDDTVLEKEADTMGAKALGVSPETEVSFIQKTAPGQPIVQRYRIQHNIKISDNGLYRIDLANEHQLQVAPGAAGPQPAQRFHIVGQTPDGYDIYEFKGVFRNDCLGFAEYLSRGKYKKEPAFRAKGDKQLKNDRDRLFGQSDNQNLSISEEARGKKRKSVFSQAEEANPVIGEAYSIVRGEIEDDECPYHIAFVVANDGGDNVTCEADASDDARSVPVFDMYATPQKKKAKGGSTTIVTNGETFHDTYKDDYTTSGKPKIPAVTGILTVK
jgi:hypothetical protein